MAWYLNVFMAWYLNPGTDLYIFTLQEQLNLQYLTILFILYLDEVLDNGD
jgi:hypothetical protein